MAWSTPITWENPVELEFRRKAILTYVVMLNSGLWLMLGLALVGTTG